MPYFSKDFMSFFRGLEKNNSKEWFDAHRNEYEQQVKAPFRALVTDLIERINSIDPRYHTTAAEAVFRINRDIRFSANKQPYKTNVAASIAEGGRKVNPGFYIHFDAKQGLVGGGAYDLQKEELERLRHYLAAHPGVLAKAAAHPKFTASYGHILGEKNKSLPPLFKEAATKEPYLFNKQFYFMQEMKSDILLSDTVLDVFTDCFIAAKPVLDVLKNALA